MTQQKHRIFLFQAVTFFFWFSLYAYVPNLSAYAKSLRASLTVVGMITGVYGLTQMLLRIPLGMLSDILKKRRMFVTSGFAFTGLAALTLYAAASPWMLIAGRAVAGVAAATWVVSTVLYSSYFAPEESTRAMSRLNASNYTGQLMGMLLGSAAVSCFGYRAMFLVALAGSVAGLVVSIFSTENVPLHAPRMRLADSLRVLADERLLYVSVTALFLQVYNIGTMSGFSPLLAEALGAGSMGLGILSMVNTGFVILGALLAGSGFVKKWGEPRFLYLCSLLLAAFTVTIPYAPNFPLLCLQQGLGGFVQGALFSLLLGLSIRHIPVERRASAMGVYQAVYGIGMFLGPVLAGRLGDLFGLKWAYLFIAVLCALMLLPAYLWSREESRAKLRRIL